MKRTFILSIIVAGASLALCPGLRAQDASPAPVTTGTDASAGHKWGRGGGGDMLERLTKALDLTAEQQTQIKPILEDTRKQTQAIRQDTSLSREDKMAKIKSIRETMNTQIDGILTADQQKKFAELKEKMRGHRRGGGADGAPSPAAAASATP